MRNESGFEYVKSRYSLGLGLELPVFEFVYAFLLGVDNFFYIKNNELIWFYFRIFYIIFFLNKLVLGPDSFKTVGIWIRLDLKYS